MQVYDVYVGRTKREFHTETRTIRDAKKIYAYMEAEEKLLLI